MSLRSTGYQNHTPATTPSTSSPHHVLNAYPFPPTAPQSAQSQHQAQLASYRRDPAKVPTSSRARYLHVRYPSSGGRRPSAVIEEGPSTEGDESGKYRDSLWSRGWRLHLPLAIGSYSALLRSTRKSRYGRMLIYVAATLILYLFFLRPISPPVSSSSSLGSHSIGAKPHSTTLTTPPLPLRQRQRSHTRAPLPLGVTSHSAPDHDIRKGLLRVNSESRMHPIYQLIRDGRQEWDAKVARQSKTLKEAVEEYTRRYKRNPPRGFDKWWDYVVEHSVQLPDEYDRINADLSPFFALSPKDLKSRIAYASQKADTYTLRVRHGSLRSSVTYDREVINGADERLAGQMDLMKPIVKWLPDMSIVYSVHDTPTHLLGWDHRRELMEHVEDDEWIDEDDEIDLTLRGWSNACPPGSPLRVAARNYGTSFTHAPTLPHTSLFTKSFVSDHKQSMSICDHPELIPLHGSLAGKNPAVSPLTSIFSLSKTDLHADILGVPTEQFVDDLPVLPWGERNGEQLLWRGSNTGAFYELSTPWKSSHRTRLVTLGDDEEPGRGRVTVLPAPRSMKGMTLAQTAEEIEWNKMNEHYMDVAFTGMPIQCDDYDGSCDDLQDQYRWEDMMTHEEALRYKYIVDVDGNAWSARFKRLLTSGSLILKSTIHPEWWTDRIQPWVHYVPVQTDYSEVYDIMAFFRGDISSKGSEQDLARDIAESGREWSLANWRKEDMTAYVFRLYLEWGRLVSDKRKSMDFVLGEELENDRQGF